MYIDRDIDYVNGENAVAAHPKRSVSPPTTPRSSGWVMGISSGFWLVLTVNVLSAVLAVSAFLFYVVIYSMWLKRTTVHNTVLGGAAGAAPALIGWAAVTGSIEWTGVLLFLVVFAWQPPHFWALALLLADDYRNANIPMLPAVRGETETKQQTLVWGRAHLRRHPGTGNYRAAWVAVLRSGATRRCRIRRCRLAPLQDARHSCRTNDVPLFDQLPRPALWCDGRR